jgi:hypothetical protein
MKATHSPVGPRVTTDSCVQTGNCTASRTYSPSGSADEARTLRSN